MKCQFFINILFTVLSHSSMPVAGIILAFKLLQAVRCEAPELRLSHQMYDNI
jgi:hypothetical protein